MSAKLLYTMSDENPDLKKQIGCMNGIFQLFDRQHFLSGRRVHGQKPKRILAGESGNNGVVEANNSALKKATENNQKAVKEKQRISTESSRTSFSSSSCSSSFSSFDCNKVVVQLEPETPSGQFPTNQSMKFPRSLDLRDVVKDCMYREARGLLVKTKSKDEARVHTLKHVDSPRPMQLPKSAKPKDSGHNESFRVAKLREGSWNEGRNDSPVFASKDYPRFSFDGREMRDTFKYTTKLKELPRLSLDSRQSTMKGSTHDMKSNHIFGDLQRRNENFNKIQSPRQELGCYKGSSSVVAKLMGLEASPDSISTKKNCTELLKLLPEEQADKSWRSTRKVDEIKQNRFSGSARDSHSEPISPWQRNGDPAIKSSSSLKLSTEPAPLRQPDYSRGTQVPASKCWEPAAKVLKSPSVYGEIEKRLTELEFKKSGKDLRALKQILETMQKTKEMLETRKGPASNFVSRMSNDSIHDQTSNLPNTRGLQSTTPVTINGTSYPKHFKSPIVIMKIATVVERASNPASSIFPADSASGLRRLRTDNSNDCKKDFVDKQMAKDVTPRIRDPSSSPLQNSNKNACARDLRSRQISKVPQHVTRKNTTSTGTNSGTVSPRLQQKLEWETQYRPTTPTSDLSRNRRQLSRQPIESGSPGKKTRPKSPSSRHNQLDKTSSSVRDLKEHCVANSLISMSNISLASSADRQITNIKTSSGTNNTFDQNGQKQESPAAKLVEDMPTIQSAIASLEQPSPVSVLDATYYRDESPSPVKTISTAFKDDWTTNFDGVEWNLDQNYTSISNKSNLSWEIHHNKSENTRCLAQSPEKDRPISDYTATLYENADSDHRYIFEILLASGLFRALDSGVTVIQLHQSGHPINPHMFFELEEIKASTGLPYDVHAKERFSQSKSKQTQRKLIFDAVNEILVHKLSNKPAGRGLRSQQLFREICAEINQQQANSNYSLDEEDDPSQSIIREELMHRANNWTDCRRELPGVVLDIERMVFKDLISEIVSSEVVSLQHVSKHRRKLFSK